MDRFTDRFYAGYFVVVCLYLLIARVLAKWEQSASEECAISITHQDCIFVVADGHIGHVLLDFRHKIFIRNLFRFFHILIDEVQETCPLGLILIICNNILAFIHD